jgi:hypothetical protein
MTSDRFQSVDATERAELRDGLGRRRDRVSLPRAESRGELDVRTVAAV